MSFYSLRGMTVGVVVAVGAVCASSFALAQETRPADAAAAVMDKAGAHVATATLLDAQGKDVGVATLTEVAGGGVMVNVAVKGLAAGEHGLHVHETGTCTAPDFKSAGGHWNPTGKKHGKDNPEGHHAGDIPNLVVKDDGTGTADFTIEGATLAAGDMSLMDKDGSAIVIHAKGDDYKTDPSGASGDRIACGIVKEAMAK